MPHVDIYGQSGKEHNLIIIFISYLHKFLNPESAF